MVGGGKNLDGLVADVHAKYVIEVGVEFPFVMDNFFTKTGS